MQLSDTIELMQSEYYIARFQAEYVQLSIRLEKLSNMIDNWDNLSFVPTCDKSVYVNQREAMEKYRNILRYRASIEKITLLE